MVARLILACAVLLAFAPASAQTACLTPNCVLGGTPAACANLAAPRTTTVLLGQGGNVFTPSSPKIEQGDCVLWRVSSGFHSSSGDACPDGTACTAASPPACQWDSANITNPATTTCYYDPARFPAVSSDNFYCRFHASPTAGTMRGTLQVTSTIQLSVDKDLATSSVKLSWTGGGVAGDISYKVVRQSAGDPTFPAPSTTVGDPDGGAFGATFTDVGDLVSGIPRYYLVRNKQQNE
jgi:hypothetical protein